MTPKETQRYQRASDARWYWRFCHFWLAPFVETWHGMSLVRLIAASLTVATVYVMIVSKTITAGAIGMATLALAAAFGKKVFLRVSEWLTHRMSLQQHDTTARVELHEVREVVERRAGQDFETTP
jgi:hypothetical protein